MASPKGHAPRVSSKTTKVRSLPRSRCSCWKAVRNVAEALCPCITNRSRFASLPTAGAPSVLAWLPRARHHMRTSTVQASTAVARASKRCRGNAALDLFMVGRSGPLPCLHQASKQSMWLGSCKAHFLHARLQQRAAAAAAAAAAGPLLYLARLVLKPRELKAAPSLAASHTGVNHAHRAARDAWTSLPTARGRA